MMDIIHEQGAHQGNDDDVMNALWLAGCPKCKSPKIRITYKAGQEERPVASHFCHPDYVANINRALHIDVRNKRKRPDIEVVIEQLT